MQYLSICYAIVLGENIYTQYGTYYMRKGRKQRQSHQKCYKQHTIALYTTLWVEGERKEKEGEERKERGKRKERKGKEGKKKGEGG